jgi:hypothetical protein
VEIYDPQQKKILHNWEREDVEEGHWAEPVKPISTQPMYTYSECNFGKLFKQRRIIYKREAQNGQKHLHSCVLLW